MTAATITNLTSELIEERVLCESDTVDERSRVGRRKVLLAVQEGHTCVMAVHLGGHQMTCGLVDIKGNILHREDYDSSHLSVVQVLNIIEQYVARVQGEKNLIGISIGVNGYIDFETGTIERRSDAQWNGVKLLELVEQATSLPVTIDNNVRTMALAEKLFGQGKELNHLLFLFVGKGVGGGLIINGVPYRTGHGEIGHISINQHSERCWCGNIGCVELYAGEAGILQKAGVAITDLSHTKSPSIEDLIERQTDPAVKELLRDVGTALGVGLVNTLNVLFVERVIVCGPLVQVDSLWDALNRTLRERIMIGRPKVEVARSSYKISDVGLLGAASLGIYQFVLMKGLEASTFQSMSS